MKMRTVIIILSLTFATSSFGTPILYDFQNISAGSLPGGFLSMTTDGVNVIFGGDGTTVGVNPVTGTHVLYPGNYVYQLGIEFSAQINQITLGLDGSFPTANNSAYSNEYYGPGYNLYGMPTISSSGSTLVFNVPNNFPNEVFGILVNAGGNGYSLDYVSIQTVPDPPATTLFLLGATAAMALRVRKQSNRDSAANATA